MTLTDALWLVIDCVFPVPRPLSKQAIRREIQIARQQRSYCAKCLQSAPGIDEGAVLSRYLAECTNLLESEDSRRQGVEARLTSILGLFTIAGTIVFSGILAQAVGTLRAHCSAVDPGTRHLLLGTSNLLRACGGRGGARTTWLQDAHYSEHFLSIRRIARSPHTRSDNQLSACTREPSTAQQPQSEPDGRSAPRDEELHCCVNLVCCDRNGSRSYDQALGRCCDPSP